MARAKPRAGELTTANYGWTKPTVGASDDAWGGYLNADLDGIDSVVHGIQTSIPAVPAASTTPPIMDGTASAGLSSAWSRGDHVHPTDTSLYPASNPSGYQTAAQVTVSLANYLPLTGGTLTGPLTPAAGVVGVTNGSNAPSGQIGEVIQAGSGTVALDAAGDAQNLISVVLTPGDWDVWAQVMIVAVGSLTQWGAGLSVTSLSIPPPTFGVARVGMNCAMPAGGTNAASLGPIRANLTASTTYYLAAYSAGAGTSNASGIIQARRRR